TEGFRTLREQLTSAWVEGARGRAALDAMGIAYIRFAIDNPSHYRVMFGGFVDPEAHESELATEAAGSFQALVDALAALQAKGEARADDTLHLAQFVWAVVHGVAMLVIDGRLHAAGDVEQLMRFAIARLGTGIDAPGPRAEPT
ncbi:MAG: TetR-like C-terminal domain-containing protein, partial [Vicinamibacterales bacterium]